MFLKLCAACLVLVLPVAGFGSDVPEAVRESSVVRKVTVDVSAVGETHQARQSVVRRGPRDQSLFDRPLGTAHMPQGWDFSDTFIERPTCTDFKQGFGLNSGRLQSFSPHFSQAVLDKSRHKTAIAQRMQRCEERFAPLASEVMHPERKKTAAIHFLHTSKTGGTFFCACAWRNGKNRAREPNGFNGGANCHFLGEDGPAWMGYNSEHGLGHKEHSATPEALFDAYKRDPKIDVEGNENYLPSFGLSDKFKNVMFIRPPVDRVLAHAFEMEHVRLLDRSINDFLNHFGQLVDNYQTRTLAGIDAFHKPVGKLNETDFQLAQTNLHQFDTYLLVDRTLSDEIRSEFGWDCSLAHGRESNYPGGTSGLLSAAQVKWGKEGLARIAALNKFDEKLFQQGRILATATS